MAKLLAEQLGRISSLHTGFLKTVLQLFHITRRPCCIRPKSGVTHPNEFLPNKHGDSLCSAGREVHEFTAVSDKPPIYF